MKISTRKEAFNAGRKKYYTGEPCSRGHYSQRYVTTGGCLACNAARAQEFRKKAVQEQIGVRQNLFGYELHHDDFEQALAFCQALDLQRGRLPASTWKFAKAGLRPVTLGRPPRNHEEAKIAAVLHRQNELARIAKENQYQPPSNFNPAPPNMAHILAERDARLAALAPPAAPPHVPAEFKRYDV